MHFLFSLSFRASGAQRNARRKRPPAQPQGLSLRLSETFARVPTRRCRKSFVNTNLSKGGKSAYRRPTGARRCRKALLIPTCQKAEKAPTGARRCRKALLILTFPKAEKAPTGAPPAPNGVIFCFFQVANAAVIWYNQIIPILQGNTAQFKAHGSRQGDSLTSIYLYNLTKNLTVQSAHLNYAVLPQIFYWTDAAKIRLLCRGGYHEKVI